MLLPNSILEISPSGVVFLNKAPNTAQPGTSMIWPPIPTRNEFVCNVWYLRVVDFQDGLGPVPITVAAVPQRS